MQRTRTVVLLCAWLLAGRAVSLAQQPDPGAPAPPAPQAPAGDDDAPIRLSAELVQVDVVVTDSDGGPVTGLRAEDFEVFENDRPQTITNFTEVRPPAAAAPAEPRPGAAAPPFAPGRPRREAVRRTIALVVDDLSAGFASMVYARKALAKFVDEDMGPGDLVAVLRTSGGGTTQQFTNDKRLLHAAIDELRWNLNGLAPREMERVRVLGMETAKRAPESTVVREVDPAGQYAGAQAIDAVRYIIGGMAPLPGRKSVVLLSDGIILSQVVDPKRKDRKEIDLVVLDKARRLVDLAARSAVVVYTVQSTGLQAFNVGADVGVGRGGALQASSLDSQGLQADWHAKEGLAYLARETGGFMVANNNDLHAAVARAARDQESYYLLGYVPEASSFDAKDPRFNTISVRVKRPGLRVRSRGGYYGVPSAPAEKAPPEALWATLNSPFAATNVRLNLTPLVYWDERNEGYVRALLHIDASDLTLGAAEGGRRKATFDVIATVYDAAGALVSWRAERYDVSTKAGAPAETLRSGLVYSLTAKVRAAGGYQVRAVVRDAATGEVGTAYQYVEVPKREKKSIGLSSIILTGGDPAGGARVNPALRRFARGMALDYELFVYDPRAGDRTPPGLTARVRLVDESGRVVFEGQPRPVAPAAGEDPKRIAAGGSIQLGPEFPPGEYALQVTVTDPLEKNDSKRVRAQWAAFTVE